MAFPLLAPCRPIVLLIAFASLSLLLGGCASGGSSARAGLDADVPCGCDRDVALGGS